MYQDQSRRYSRVPPRCSVGASEHLFSMLSVIGLYKYLGLAFVGQLYDLEKYFDKEVLFLVLDSLYSSSGVKGKDYRNIYLMNKRNRIRVKTGAGYSEYAEAGELLPQGSGGAALYSQKYIDSKVDQMFRGSSDEFRYGKVLGRPAIWMDDIFRGVGSVNEAIAGNIKLDMVASLCQLSFHPDKTGYILMGTEEQKKEMRKEIYEKPIMCGNIKTKEKEADKWLGFWLHSGGLSESVAKTVHERIKKVKGALYEAVAVVEDYRAVRISGFQTAMDLWEPAILPSLLNNFEVWVEITPETEKQLEDLQFKYLCLVLQVGPGTPRPALLSQTGLLGMKFRIWIEKVLMIHHLRGLEETALASNIWSEQREKDWPGLVKEVRSICEILEIDDINEMELEHVNIKNLRAEVTEACKMRNEDEMKAKMRKKCDDIKEDDFKLQDYFKDLNLYEARELFKIKSNMNKVRGNYKNMPENKAAGWICVGCTQEAELNSHIMTCKVWWNTSGKSWSGGVISCQRRSKEVPPPLAPLPPFSPTPGLLASLSPLGWRSGGGRTLCCLVSTAVWTSAPFVITLFYRIWTHYDTFIHTGISAMRLESS